MNREIKFRAWDYVNNVMVHPGDRPYQISPWGTPFYNEERLPWMPMQYTGLKDANDVEIYEGDIVCERKSIGVIVCNEGAFEIEWKTNADFWSATLRYHAEDVEVIGNVYEHPKLLEDGETA